MKIYMIRHGETDWNTKKLLQGKTDIPLNENGRELARVTAEGLKDVPFDLIFTSPLGRARETAEILRGERQIPIIEDERIQEISFGPYEGFCCSKEGYNIPDPTFIKAFTAPGEYVPPAGAESIAELCERTTDFLHSLLNNPEYQNKTILVSGHGAVLKGLLSSLTITDLNNFWNGGVHRNCAVTILDVQSGNVTIEQENVIYYDPARSDNYFEE